MSSTFKGCDRITSQPVTSVKEMRQKLLLLTIPASLALLLFAGCGANQSSRSAANSAAANEPSATATPSDGVRRVSVAELKAALERNEAVVVDVRGEVDYNLGHIKGAASLPLGLVKERGGELPRDKMIVTYCA